MLQSLYGITIFLSALLLFFVQPLLAKAMLPLFGGSAFVWTVSILFFQAGLLLGYGYAYFLAKYFSDKTQAICHMVLLVLSCWFIPINLNASGFIETMWPPLAVIYVLSLCILVPFIVISSSSPLLQHWYCQIRRTTFPYAYYAISNLGSLLGLIGYPFLVEPFIGLKEQKVIWSFGYGLYIVLCLCCLSKLLFVQRDSVKEESKGKIPVNHMLRWLLLTFLSSALLLSVTLFLTQNVMNLPLIWVLPLAVYLISYIIIFSRYKIYDRQFWSISFVIWLLLTLWLIYSVQLAGIHVVIVFLALLFCACMFCHGELILLKPHQQYLTIFYLFIALGGVLGGIFVNIFATLLFKNWWDFFLPLTIINILISFMLFRLYSASRTQWNYALSLFSVIGAVCLIGLIVQNIFMEKNKLVAQYRNPYGFIKVIDYQFEDQSKNYRALMHGKIMHGLQFTEPKQRQWATTYYSKRSGLYVAFKFLYRSREPLRIGVIGLGSGTLATLAKLGDTIDFYDIDKDIETVALNDFSFIKESKAQVKIILGDARVQLQNALQNEGSQRYDLLVVDAFSGDAIPSHLLTQEAMQLYQNHLAKNGIIAFHTSNTYINFMPVTKALASMQQCSHYWIENKGDANLGIFQATWALITCNPEFASWIETQEIRPISTAHVKPMLWTDDYSTILPLLRWSPLH
ncbi:MAG: hypothetical protein BGO43_15890 [Gammaproteobacteria bacterium 39-13]|nr:fused MFS/spermidine synthase [Gammaproteobacteria bacterium]OJV87887.1 MAG: hypothetical protein BGO43_15890 [Gammaproteobacteria bacterium 39-13]